MHYKILRKNVFSLQIEKLTYLFSYDAIARGLFLNINNRQKKLENSQQWGTRSTSQSLYSS